MENLVRKRDILGGVVPGAFELAAGELAFSAQVDTSRRNTRITQGFPEIQQVDPATVPETPLRVREAIHFHLRIEMRVSRGEHALLERETIAPHRELRRQAHRQRPITLRSELHALPTTLSKIPRPLHR